MTQSNPFHSGELTAQERAGEREAARRNRGAITATIMTGALRFIKQQPMVLFGSRDERGAMWASLVFGRPGFLSSTDGTRLEVDLSQAHVDPNDPVWANVENDHRLGALVIETGTRRRIRVNGFIEFEPGRCLSIQVDESYPACPKYITRRQVRFLPDPAPAFAQPDLSSSGGLGDGPLAAVRSADAIFVATESPERGYDVSHRGGLPGFVKVIDPHTIRWPEFPGNSMFNTLGNLLHDPNAGVVIPDFIRNRVVQVTGQAVALWDQPDPGNETAGTRRFVEFTIEQWKERDLPSNLSSEFLDYSPFNPSVLGA